MKDSTCHGVPTKTELFQIIMMPPDAPIEGAKTNLSNHLGQKDLINAKSKDSRLVSWIHSTEQPLVSIAFLRAKVLASELMPLMFHDLFMSERKFSRQLQWTSADHAAASREKEHPAQSRNGYPSIEDLQSA